MAVAAFKILAYVDRVPTMAVCTKCEQKFFAPRLIFRSGRVGAEEYSRDKFVQHKCLKGAEEGSYRPYIAEISLIQTINRRT